jgi:hypothetical protein
LCAHAVACSPTRIQALDEPADGSATCAAADEQLGLVGHYRLDAGVGITAIDAIGGRDAALVNGPQWVADGPQALSVAHSLELDGRDDHLLLPWDIGKLVNVANTLSFWISTTIVPVGDSVLCGTRLERWGITNTGRIGFFPFEQTRNLSSEPVTDGKWHHVAIAREPAVGRIRVYADGVLGTPAPERPNPDLHSFDVFGATDDAYGELSSFYAGRISDLRFYDTALPAEAIFNLSQGKNADGSPRCTAEQ